MKRTLRVCLWLKKSYYDVHTKNTSKINEKMRPIMTRRDLKKQELGQVIDFVEAAAKVKYG